MRKRGYFRPLIPLMTALITGIVLGEGFPDYRVCFIALTCISFFLILLSIYLQKKSFIPFFVLFSALGYLSIQPWTAPKFPENHIIHFSKYKYRITGIIRTPPAEYKNCTRFIMQVKNLGENPVTGLVRVTSLEYLPDFSIYDRVSFIGRIRPIKNIKNPGGFDYQQYMAFKGIWCSVYVQEKTFAILQRHTTGSFWRFIENIRAQISGMINKTASGNARAVLKALIIGDKSSITSELRDMFNRAGISHLLAISGLHMGIITIVSFMAFKWFLSRSEYLLWNLLVRKWSAILTLIPILSYGLISGMAPSAQRALIMALVCLSAVYFNKEYDLFNTLAAAAAGILIIHPPALFSISFQLSFSAVLFIVYGFSKIQWIIDAEKWNYLKIKIFSLIVVSFFAISGTMPLTMFYFNQLSFTGLAANLVFIPLIGFISLPLALSASFLYFLNENIAECLMYISAEFLSQILKIIPWFAGLPFGGMKTITPSILEICCYYILLWTVITLIPAPEDGEKEDTMKKWAKIALIPVFLISSADAGYWIYQRFFHKDLRLTFIDVGQGNSALVEFPKGGCMLIDGGGFYDIESFDIGEAVVAPFLWSRKIRTVETLVLTHADSDHLSGLLYIAENFHVKTVLMNGVGKDNPVWHKFMEILDRKDIHVPEFRNIPRSWKKNGVSLTLLHPPRDFRPEDVIQNGHNDISLLIKMSFGKSSILFPGDISAAAEKKITETAGKALKSNILLSPHHGSRTSSTALFLEHVRPELIVISAGFQNRFNCPHPSVMKRYENMGCRIFRTDMNGAVFISINEHGAWECKVFSH